MKRAKSFGITKLFFLLVLFSGVLHCASANKDPDGSYAQAYDVGKSYASVIILQNRNSSIEEKRMLCKLYMDTLTLNNFFKNEALKACQLSVGMK